MDRDYMRPLDIAHRSLDLGEGDALRALFADQPINRVLQGREITADDLEDPIELDPEVLMSNQITEAGDIRPGDLGCPPGRDASGWRRPRPLRRADAPSRRGSQRQRLTENLGTDAVLQHVGRRDVNRHPQDVLSLAPESSDVEERPARLEVDEEVDIARGGLAASE